MTRTLALGSLLATTLLLGALPAHAAILTVDCGTGPFFDISSAVVAAIDSLLGHRAHTLEACTG